MTIIPLHKWRIPYMEKGDLSYRTEVDPSDIVWISHCSGPFGWSDTVHVSRSLSRSDHSFAFRCRIEYRIRRSAQPIIYWIWPVSFTCRSISWTFGSDMDHITYQSQLNRIWFSKETVIRYRIFIVSWLIVLENLEHVRDPESIVM